MDAGPEIAAVPLRHRFDAMWAARGASYRPRTRHIDDRGRPIYTNRLFLESSPYLLQHAHNPVDWHPWGNEAFAIARRLDRPVLLSVGYATCHWCHVMEEESFEDEAIAACINDHYVAVKVDREERPDVDAIYMSAVQAITGRGGWPMTVWLTPDREPFFGGTYFPARDGDRGQPTGFLTLLEKIHDSYAHRRELVQRTAGELSSAVKRMLAPPAGQRPPMQTVPSRAVAAAHTHVDPRHGGTTGAPKFPSSLPLRLLMRHFRRTGDRKSLDAADLTLRRMADGGINDQVGGGFHRYSTDERWRVPHFEKMLYDNALLVPAYLDGWQVTGQDRFREVAKATLDYVAREMTAPTGGFYSATDADSLTPSGHREEGYFFTWTAAELEDALGPADARLAAGFYGVTAAGNLDGRTVLHRPRPLAAAAEALMMPAADLAAALARINRTLYDRRARRSAPLRDDKILSGWNGLMISAFARAGFVLNDAGYVERAVRAAEFIRRHMIRGDRLARSFTGDILGGEGFLEDYAFFAAGLLDLFAVTARPFWLEQAIALDRSLAERFEDRPGGGFFMTTDDHEPLIAREKPCLDGALPSGNAVALMNLVRLGDLTADDRYRRRAERGFSAFSSIMEASPSAFGEMLQALDDYLHPPPQIIVAARNDGEAAVLMDILRRAYLPGCLVMRLSETRVARLADGPPGLVCKTTVDGRATAYICRQGTCEAPITDPQILGQRLENMNTGDG